MKYRKGGTGYSSAIGRIRVKEKALFNKAYLYSLADAVSADEIINMLAKTPYAKYVAEISGGSDYSKLLRSKLRSVRSMYRRLLSDENINFFLWGINDFDNVKILFKAKFMEIEPKDLSETGNIDTNKLKSFILKGEKANVPKWVTDSMKEVSFKYEATKDPGDISMVLDNKYFNELKVCVKKIGSKFLNDLLKVEIDLFNLKTMLRVKEQKQDKKYLSEVYVPGGTKDLNFFSSLLDVSYDEIVSTYKNLSYGKIIEAGVEQFIKERSFYKLEKMIDDHKLAFVRQVKHAVFGYEPLIGYVFARRSESKAIEMIFEGKYAGMEPAYIKERIPEVYV